MNATAFIGSVADYSDMNAVARLLLQIQGFSAEESLNQQRNESDRPLGNRAFDSAEVRWCSVRNGVDAEGGHPKGLERRLAGCRPR